MALDGAIISHQPLCISFPQAESPFSGSLISVWQRGSGDSCEWGLASRLLFGPRGRKMMSVSTVSHCVAGVVGVGVGL